MGILDRSGDSFPISFRTDFFVFEMMPRDFALSSRRRYRDRDRVLVYIQSDVFAILFHGLSSLLVALGLRLS